VGGAVAKVEVQRVLRRTVDDEEKICADAVIEKILEVAHAAIDLGVVKAQRRHHLA